MYSKAVSQVLERERKAKPALIQERTCDAIHNGASLVRLARIGMERTPAYELPVIKRTDEIGGRGVTLGPTTELAI